MLYEFRLAEKLNHPNVVQYKYFVRQFDPASGLHQFHNIMEHLKGSDLRRFMKEKSRCGIDQVQQIGFQIILGIKYLH